MRSQKLKKLITHGLLLVTCCLLLVPCYSSLVTASDKWQGVDESVVEKYAKEHGREAREPFINTDQGDLLLFVFLIAGVVGGFAAGYYWRILIVEKKDQNKHEELLRSRNVKSD
jgi:hypothetical protein